MAHGIVISVIHAEKYLMQRASKRDFEVLCEIRQLKRKLGIAEQLDSIMDLEAERDRLRRLVKVCE